MVFKGIGRWKMEGRTREENSRSQPWDVQGMPENRDGKIYVRFLNCIRDSKFKLRIDNICFTTIGKKYDDDPFDWFKVICNIKIGNDHKTSKFWCSALVAYSYILLSFLNPKIPWSMIKPSDFSSRNVNSILKFNCCLTDDVQVLY